MKQDPLRTISDILDASDSDLWPYEVEINGEIVQLNIDSIKLIKKELDKAVQNKQMEDAIRNAIKSVTKKQHPPWL